MVNEWTLGTIWNILVQAPLLILSEIANIFKILVGIDVVESFSSSNGFNIFLIYGPLVLIAFAISIFLIFYKVLKSKIDDVIETRKNLISTFKYLFINLLLVVLIPVFVFGIGIGLSFLAEELLKVFTNNWNTGNLYETLSGRLYWIGYIKSSPAIDIPLSIEMNFAPPSTLKQLNIEYYQNSNWNYIIEIFSVLITCFLPFYLCVTFIQKIIEIFILCTFSPFLMINNMIDDGAKFKALLFQTLRKSIIVVWTVFCFIAFQLFANLLSNLVLEQLKKDSSSRGLIYLFAIIAVVSSLYLTSYYISRKTNQKIGFIGIYKSSKQTLMFEREIRQPLPKVNMDSDEYIKSKLDQNTQAINAIKNTVSNQTSVMRNKLSRVNIFKD